MVINVPPFGDITLPNSLATDLIAQLLNYIDGRVTITPAKADAFITLSYSEHPEEDDLWHFEDAWTKNKHDERDEVGVAVDLGEWNKTKDFALTVTKVAWIAQGRTLPAQYAS